MYRNLLTMALIIYGLPAFGIPHKASVTKQNKYLDQGVIVGGRAGRGFSLLNVRRDIAKNQSLERIIMDLGDFEGKPHRGRAGYFHANVESNPPRLVLDMHQMIRSAVDEAKLRSLFQKSPFVKRVSIVADPEDNTTSLLVDLKQPAKVEVFELPANKKSPSRLVVDLKADSRSGK